MVSVPFLRTYVKPVLHLVLAVPLLWLTFNWIMAFSGAPHDLGFNPQETSNRFSGEWAMRIFLFSFAVTPLVRLTGSKKWILFRRMLGVWSFVYVMAHITSYVWLDMAFAWAELWEDLLKRTYITVGMVASLGMLALVLTSWDGAVRRMGAKAWTRLHKLVYGIGPLIILHFIMMRKGWQVEPLVYGAILVLLLGVRFLPKRVKRHRLRRVNA